MPDKIFCLGTVHIALLDIGAPLAHRCWKKRKCMIPLSPTKKLSRCFSLFLRPQISIYMIPSASQHTPTAETLCCCLAYKNSLTGSVAGPPLIEGKRIESYLVLPPLTLSHVKGLLSSFFLSFFQRLLNDNRCNAGLKYLFLKSDHMDLFHERTTIFFPFIYIGSRKLGVIESRPDQKRIPLDRREYEKEEDESKLRLQERGAKTCTEQDEALCPQPKFERSSDTADQPFFTERKISATLSSPLHQIPGLRSVVCDGGRQEKLPDWLNPTGHSLEDSKVQLSLKLSSLTLATPYEHLLVVSEELVFMECRNKERKHLHMYELEERAELCTTPKHPLQFREKGATQFLSSLLKTRRAPMRMIYFSGLRRTHPTRTSVDSRTECFTYHNISTGVVWYHVSSGWSRVCMRHPGRRLQQYYPTDEPIHPFLLLPHSPVGLVVVATFSFSFFFTCFSASQMDVPPGHLGCIWQICITLLNSILCCETRDPQKNISKLPRKLADWFQYQCRRFFKTQFFFCILSFVKPQSSQAVKVFAVHRLATSESPCFRIQPPTGNPPLLDLSLSLSVSLYLFLLFFLMLETLCLQIALCLSDLCIYMISSLSATVDFIIVALFHHFSMLLLSVDSFSRKTAHQDDTQFRLVVCTLDGLVHHHFDLLSSTSSLLLMMRF
ncbi:hypothetical protein VP01_2217g4 [Puccinia sorghi]|uniref:Uncharacterized protein n=1 Tax=Puccinia sorghi TaxID=27349 RepID=A0A0L6V8U6_9BASI|nr:hypothetical protein VP01_2217g4 [Puccinia sorghi]